ncbi:MAG: hypothetical protein PHE17_10125 [Thiothrix sp.]|uniref:hypothetical protein n=1 Tax=Thiothrix sp. TaxID=1032 RepID=UPI00262F0CE0|nr:hypothetical protein [Thiothrix sp.]MDD5393364.1 hypothetical protein [Thiothrix sp.]
MKNPIITVSHGNFVTVSQHARQFAMYVIADESALKNLICSFLENGKDLYAAVIAPMEDAQWLPRRVVSFIGAHMHIHDAEKMEREIQHGIEHCLSNNRSY